jgi:antitoxin CcdA
MRMLYADGGYDPEAPRKPTNVTVNTSLLKLAREQGLNLSRLLEERLIEVLVDRQRAAWASENREAIEAYNRRVAARGVFGDKLRRF